MKSSVMGRLVNILILFYKEELIMSEEKKVNITTEKWEPPAFINGVPRKYAYGQILAKERNREVKDKYFIRIGYIENDIKYDSKVWYKCFNDWWMATTLYNDRNKFGKTGPFRIDNLLYISYKYDKAFVKYIEDNLEKIEFFVDESTLCTKEAEETFRKKVFGENNEKWDKIVEKAENKKKEEKRLLELKKEKKENSFYKIVDGELKGLTKKGLEELEKNPHLILPKGIKTIGKDAFKKLNIVSVDIPEGVEKIKESAFYYCMKLERVNLPVSLKYIDDKAFCCCPVLTNLKLPKSLYKIGDYAFFKSCMSEWSNFELPEGLEIIGENAFTHTAIKKVRLPKSIRQIGFNAFDAYFEEIILPCSFEELFVQMYISHLQGDIKHSPKFIIEG